MVRFCKRVCLISWGLSDELVLCAPAEIAQVHRAYLEAWADCITTCTFNNHDNRDLCFALLSGREKNSRRIHAQDEYSSFCFGDVRPTNEILSLLPQNVPDLRTLRFEEFKEAYRVQMAAMIEDCADAILI